MKGSNTAGRSPPQQFDPSCYWRQLKHSLAAMLPNRCLMCHQTVKLPNTGLCTICLAAVLYQQPICLGCGRSMQITTDFCGSCAAHDSLKIIAPASYHQGVGPWIAAMKYHAQFAALEALVDALIARLHSLIEAQLLILPQALIPVPLHPKRLKQRGFNQAFVIAQCLSKKLNIPLLTKGIVRVKNTQAQAGLSGKARRVNLNDAFELTQPLGIQRVALVDDVVTTGTTVKVLAAQLAQQAIQVQVWCLARAEAPGLLD